MRYKCFRGYGVILMKNKLDIYEIMDEARDLGKKIKEYEEEANQELVINWIYDTLEVVIKLGKAVDSLQERFELLEDSLKE
jgi:hypothetical protein